MKKFIIATFVAMGAVTFLGGCSTSEQNNVAQLQEIVDNNESVATVPDRNPETNGIVSSVNGNVIVVKDEIGREILTVEEQAEKKAERQKMTQEERQALRAQEMTGLETEDITITVPAGTILVKGTGNGDGSSTKATFSDLKQGAYVSVWVNEEVVEAIKIKGL